MAVFGDSGVESNHPATGINILEISYKKRYHLKVKKERIIMQIANPI